MYKDGCSLLKKTSTNKSLSATCLHLGCHLNTHTKPDSDIAATETDILWDCNLNSRAIQAKTCLLQSVLEDAFLSPRCLICAAMQALFIQGPICLYVPTYSLWLLIPAHNKTLFLAACMPTQCCRFYISVQQQLHLLSAY